MTTSFAATDGGARSPRRKRQDRVDLRNYTLLIVVAVVFAVFQVLTDGLFLSQRNLGLLALQATIVGLASISAVMLIVTRNFDLSVGSAVALVGVVLASLTVKLGWNPWLAVVAAIAAGVVLGAWNAVWVAKVGVSSFIVTLAGMMIFRGISLIVTDGATVAPLPATLTDLAAGYLAPAPSIVLVIAALGGFTAVHRRVRPACPALRPGERLAPGDHPHDGAGAAGHRDRRLRLARQGDSLPHLGTRRDGHDGRRT